jgi:hypothetical protein
MFAFAYNPYYIFHSKWSFHNYFIENKKARRPSFLIYITELTKLNSPMNPHFLHIAFADGK